jgi:hypothetical protein
MKEVDIEQLLAAFYEGETTREEEELLYRYFSEEDIPSHLNSDKKLFTELFRSSASSVKVPDGLDGKLNTLIDTLSENERNEQTPATARNKRIKLLQWRRIAGIAASLLIVMSAGIFLFRYNRSDNRILADTYNDPQKAYIETQKTLLLVSSKLNKGLGHMEVIERDLDKTQKIIEKNIQL